MASSIVQNVTSADVGSMCQNLQSTEPCSQGSNEDSVFSMSSSLHTSSSFGPYTASRGESQSPTSKHDYSIFSTQPRQMFSESTNFTIRDGNQNKSEFLDQLTSSQTSTSGPGEFDKSHHESIYQQKSKDLSSQFSLDALLSNNMDSYKTTMSPAQEKSSDNKWDYGKDYSFNRASSSSHCETNAQKYRTSSSFDVTSVDIQSQSQSFDFETMKQKYSFNMGNETNSSTEADNDSTKIRTQSKQLYYDFESSDLALRLRNSLQSDFLSSELRQTSISKMDDIKTASSGSLRAIEDILKQYGISGNASRKLTQNTETSTKGSKTTAPKPGPSTLDKDTPNSFTSTVNLNKNSQFRPEAKKNSFLEAMNLPTSFNVNVSHGDNSTLKLECDPLKSGGSSVDFTSGKIGLYSAGENFKPFEYPKPLNLSCDNPRIPNRAFSNIDTKSYEGGLDLNKFQNCQVDFGKTNFHPEKTSTLEMLSNMGTATEALEYSMLNERQRLRKLDTMISGTPLNYSMIELPKSMKTQFKSPGRSYSSLRNSDLMGKSNFSSTIPSTSYQAAVNSHKNHLGGNLGQREPSAALSKSTSVPGSGVHHVQSTGKKSAFVEPRLPYWNYNFNPGNHSTYSGGYRSQYSEKNPSQKNCDKNQKKTATGNKKECPLRNKKTAPDNYYATEGGHQPLYIHSSTGINFLSSRKDTNNATERKRPLVRNSASTKKPHGANQNQSKNIKANMEGFDFVKDLNRMWQEAVFGPSLGKAIPNQKQKYTPYRPMQSKKEEKQTTAAQIAKEIFGSNYAPISARKSESNWAVGYRAAVTSAGSDYDFDGGLGLYKQAQNTRSQSVLEQQPYNSQTKPKASSVKQKSAVQLSLRAKQAKMAPKSILKQTSGKTNSNAGSGIHRPHSALAVSNKSYTQSSYQIPYNLVRGFSPVDLQRLSRSQTSASMKKEEPSSKRKLVTRNPTPKLVRH